MSAAAWLSEDELARIERHKGIPLENGVGVVVWRDGLVLLGLRTGSHAAEQWALPGGAFDPGEGPLDCAKRELGEEAGALAENWRELGCFSYDVFEDAGRRFVTTYLQCDLPADVDVRVMEPHKLRRWGFFDPQSPPGPLMAGTAKALRAASMNA